VQKVHPALQPPESWRNQEPKPEEVATFQKEVGATALAFADKAREFIARWPTNDNISDARITVVHALTHAVAAGRPEAEPLIAAYVAATLADKSIPEDDRAGVLLFSGNAVMMKKVGMRLFTQGMNKLRDEFEARSIDSMRAALKQFPTNAMLFTMLVSAAEQAKGEARKEMAQELMASPNAPPGVKTLAEHILKGTRPYEVGRPLDIKFTALDGREVDLAKLTGKVVLVEFWSTTCGPCLAEMPHVKAAYDNLHPRGFEVVAISLDDKESAVRRFVKEKDLSWPQHFDGKGWGNQFALKYGIFGIPTMWLVDKRGNLRDTNARFDLERRIKQLLDEPTPSKVEAPKS
jgi:thiol-disulfide isomerase/thioredoxin